MSNFFKNALGGGKASEPVAKQDSDFADFAGAPDPVPEPAPVATPLSAPAPGATAVPWTAWYNVHERHSLSEFRAEGYILGVAAVVVFFHLLGSRTNRAKARAWIRSYAPILKSEYAVVGFDGVATMDNDVNPDKLMKEKSLFEFATYGTGRQNTAFTDIKITLNKRFNPLMHFSEILFGLFLDSVSSPYDYLEAFTYPFDGKEAATVPALPGAETRSKDNKSAYDGFVWAIVAKDVMRKARDERYDLSLTTTRDHPKLPNWLSVMTESAEITDVMLTQELIDAVVTAGDKFEYLIVSDQPNEKPSTLNETRPRKRIILRHRVPSGSSTSAYDSLLPIFSYFVRLPDFLAQNAHFRPEAIKKVRATRDAMIASLQKLLDEKESEERAIEREKAKKAKRAAELQGLDPKAQKKYLERESAKEMRRAQKKQAVRG
ncbi:hypothetical protein NLU13_2331 [Sarocladium strictum]|uniref:DUF1682-domain-containing protein n=1 Tax=Sarocladium strictum TaxID=5046 RepID=A0AA39LD48_SARSR|nr:hypothetical protein NLU13_2331 [Sarocladium strictum]